MHLGWLKNWNLLKSGRAGFALLAGLLVLVPLLASPRQIVKPPLPQALSAPARQSAGMTSLQSSAGFDTPFSSTPLASNDTLRAVQDMKRRGQYDPAIWTALHESSGRGHSTLDQGGEDCANAETILSIPYSATGTTAGYIDDYDYSCPYTGSSAPDVVYRYSPVVSEFVKISLCGSDFDTKLYVIADDCASAPVACNDDACPMSSGWPFASYLSNLLLQSGHVYYIVVDGFGHESGDYQLTLERTSRQCIISTLQETPSFGYTEWLSGDQILIWIQPDCGPNQSFALDSLTLSLADAAAFNKPDGAGTLEYRISIICADGQNPCFGPNRWLFTSPSQFFNTDGLRGITSQTILADLCLSGEFFIALEFLNWNGNPRHVPSPVWDTVNPSPCHQWFCRGGCFDFSHAFDPGETGNLDLTAYLSFSACEAQTCPEPCDLNCPPLARRSVEPVCSDGYADAFNGGCNRTPLYFEPLPCGDTLCAALGSFLSGGRPAYDADWYQFDLSDSASIDWTIVAPFTLVARLYSSQSGCGSVPIAASTMPSLNYAACDTVRLSAVVDGGSYWLECRPYNWEYLPCGSTYFLWSSCVPLHRCDPNNVCCGTRETEPNNSCDNQIDPATFLNEGTLCASICPAGDTDYYLWVIPNGVRSTLNVFSGDSCTVQPADVILSLLDSRTCLDASGGQPPTSVGWTIIGPARLVIRAEGNALSTESRYRLVLASETIGSCPAACYSAPLLPFDSSVVISTCDGCRLYPGTFESECTGPRWISGLQRFFHLDVLDPATYTVSLVGDTTFPGGRDVQYSLFTECPNPDSTCVFSQDRNFPDNEITGPFNTESASVNLPAGDYLLAISSYDILETGATCASMTLRVSHRCDPVSDLRCAPNNSNQVALFWTAPQSGHYSIWSTVIRNNDGNPDNGADPQWIQNAEFNLSAGPVAWTDGQPIQDYINYVVVHDCR